MNQWHHKGSSHQRGYGWAWQRLRVAVLERDRYLCQCQECKSSGRVRVAHEVDHVIPKAKGGTDAMSNLQSINRQCHARKNILDQGHEPKPKVTVGVDGWPL